MQSAHLARNVPRMACSQETAALVPAAGRESREGDDGEEALWRLSRLPLEVQEAVIRHLPLADIAAWQRVNKQFAHRIRVTGMREQALFRVLASAFPDASHKVLMQDLAAWRSLGSARLCAALSRDNYDRLLRPWLESFATNPLKKEWPGTAFEPSVLFCAISRTLQASPRLFLVEKASFQLSEPDTEGAPSFSPDGLHLMVSSKFEVPGRYGSCICSTSCTVFSQNAAGWYEGSPFTQTPVVSCLCFSADGRRVAVMEEVTEGEKEKKTNNRVLFWEKEKTGVWQQRACFDLAALFRLYEPSMLFSPDGRCLLLLEDKKFYLGFPHLWELDVSGQWRLSEPYPLSPDTTGAELVFSPDSRWLLGFRSLGTGTMLYRRQSSGSWVADYAIESVAHLLQGGGCFSFDSQQLVLLAKDSTLTLWRLHEDAWSGQGSIRYRYPIDNVWFSPDGRQLVIRALGIRAKGEFALLEADAQGEWKTLRVLGESWPYDDFAHFDPPGRWLAVGSSTGIHDIATLWVKDSAGSWTQSAMQLCGGCNSLVASSDGLHIAELELHVMGADVRLSGFEQGRWTLRAVTERITTASGNQAIAMDSLCRYLAVTCYGGVAFLRVQPAREAVVQ